MKRYNVTEIAEGVYWVGAKDWNRRIFDALIPLPQGTSYNAYLVRGKKATALIDTVSPAFEKAAVEKIGELGGLTKLDYIVMNHAEPDHAGAIPHLMAASKKAVLLATEKGAKMASTYFKVPEERIKIVRDGENIELGDKTLKFIEAPWLHWPETMFTYLTEGKVLFPCDYFGAHTAFGFYDEDVEEIISSAKKYFGAIMMPFRKRGAKALEKIKDLDIEIIAPSHGPIYRNPERIIEVYRKWTAGATKEKTVVIYVSMWKSTEFMIETIVETLLSEGIEVSLYNLSNSGIDDIARDLVDSRAIVLGAPTVLGGMHPVGIYASHLVKILRPPLEYGVILSSYGWAGGALKQASDILGPTRIQMVGALEVKGPPSEADCQKIVEIGKNLSNRIKG